MVVVDELLSQTLLILVYPVGQSDRHEVPLKATLFAGQLATQVDSSNKYPV